QRVERVLSVSKTSLDILGDRRGRDAALWPRLDGGGGKTRCPGDAVSRQQSRERAVPGKPNDVAKLEPPVHDAPAASRRVCDRNVEERSSTRGLRLERIVRVEGVAPRQA